MATIGKHGGARPGAGRPKSTVERESLRIRLGAADRALLDKLCAELHLSQSELVSRALDRLGQDYTLPNGRSLVQKKPSKSK